MKVLESVRVVNDVDRLTEVTEVTARAGQAGASVHSAHPLGVKAFEYRRVKNDVRDAIDVSGRPGRARRRRFDNAHYVK